MNLTTLEQIVGPINRGQLDGGFKPSYEPALEPVEAFFSDDTHRAKPPPLTEDLSHLNGPATEKMKALAKGVWDKMTPENRRERLKNLSKAGKIGGSATKDMRHLHGVVINRKRV